MVVMFCEFVDGAEIRVRFDFVPSDWLMEDNNILNCGYSRCFCCRLPTRLPSNIGAYRSRRFPVHPRRS